MDIHRVCSLIAEQALRCLARVTTEEVAHFRQRLEGAASIFCAAQGRSGYVLRCFCMRLMHMGYHAHFEGDTVTPPIGGDDILVVLSGSGQTSCTSGLIERAKKARGATFGILGTKHSPMRKRLDEVIYLPGTPEADQAEDLGLSQPLGSSFEQTAFILFEAVAHDLFVRQGADQATLQQRHTNLE